MVARELSAKGAATVECEETPPIDDRFDLVAAIDQGTGDLDSGHRIGVIINPDLEAAIAFSLSRESDVGALQLVIPDLIEPPRGQLVRLWRYGAAAIWPKMPPADLASELLVVAGVAEIPPPRRAGRRIHASIMRVIDVAVGLSIMTLGLPALALIAVAIRRDSPGPALFSQQRVGRNGRGFTLYKFRTMVVGTRQAGTHEVAHAAVTRLGARLRHLKLDELPQAWNLLTGDLTLVGPRPCLPVQQELVEERRRRGVLALKPGLTGLAQIAGIDMSEPGRLARVDATYASLRGVALDLAIIARTFFGAGRGDRTQKNLIG